MLKTKTFKSLNNQETSFFESIEGIKIPKNKISLLVSQSGIGKSFLILKFLMEMANKGIKSYYIAAEDEDGEIKSRMKLIFEEYKYDENKIEENLFINNEIDELTYFENNNYLFNSEANELISFIKKEKVEILVIDTLDYVANFKENDNDEATEFIKLWKKEFIKKLGISLLFVHHLGKIKNKKLEDVLIDDVRGASAIASKVRYVLNVFNKENDKEYLYTKVIKSNVGQNNKIEKIKIIHESKKIMF